MLFPLSFVVVGTSFVAGGSSSRSHSRVGNVPVQRTVANDNRTPSGSLHDGVLTVHLEARVGDWHPDGDAAPGAPMPAFAEAGKAPQVPGPLIRVVAGTTVAATVRNVLPNDTLHVYGLHARNAAADGTPDAAPPIRLLPGEQRDVRFQLAAPGTYYYWATTMGRPFKYRARQDGQLNGAIVVDEPGTKPVGRVFLISMWSDTIGGAVPHGRKRVLFAVNGMSWPNTERLSYTVGDTARWRVINATGDSHPMHLHGFYFRVEGKGDGTRDTTFAEARRPLVVTELLTPGQTMDVTWIPERSGNWAFHCHLPEHIMARGPLGTPRSETHAHIANHALQGMNGLMLGIAVHPKPGAPVATATAGPRRRLRLVASERATATAFPSLNFALGEGTAEPTPDWSKPVGPPIVVTRGEPVSITVVNRSTRATAVHWHGIELESYFDGVPGFSGTPTRLSPVIAPKDSFEARFTPPRAGTFIYHSHIDEERQQTGGLAGVIIVLEPGQRYDPTTDLVALVTSPTDSAAEANAVLINGLASPAPVELRVGVAYRLRIVNITSARPGMRVDLWRDSTVLDWRLLARDGADLPDADRTIRPARQAVSIGQTADVEITPKAPGDLRFEVRANSGVTLGTLLMHVVH
jgi:FtsP/CotA-like multicopper oxidase with cupredoxin domain